MECISLNGREFEVIRLLGKGKGGYSYLVTDGVERYCLKQIHHEPCDYYTFGDKLASELNDYDRLWELGIPIPRLIEVDRERERILKEYIEGRSGYELVRDGEMREEYLDQVRALCGVLYAAGLNIDYFPTNFILRDGKLYYIDYECNGYMEQWDFEHWGCKYWSKTPEFLEYMEKQSRKKGLVLFPCDGETRGRLIQAGPGCDFEFREESWSKERYHNALRTANIIIGEPGNEELLLCRSLELMHSPSSGVNYYVEGGCFPKGAVLCCMTGGYGNIISEHLLGMVLALCRRLPEYRDQQRERRWNLLRYDKPLEGCTVLILGAGDIGTTLARWMRPMVGRIIGVRRVERPFPGCYDRMVTLAELDEVLPEADIIVCALPHTPQTVGLLDDARLRRMKKDAVLVNGGRGSLIDQEALCRLLDAGHFWGVGLEVTSPEPLPPEHPLWTQPRVIITPHAAGNSFAPGSPLERKIWDFIIENVGGYLKGREPKNQVDFATGYRRT